MHTHRSQDGDPLRESQAQGMPVVTENGLEGEVLFDPEAPTEIGPVIDAPQIDLMGLSNQLICGGADTIAIRFNVGMPGTFDEVLDQLTARFNRPNMYTRPLGQSLSDTIYSDSSAGFYFEAYDQELQERLLLSSQGSHGSELVPVTKEQRVALFQGDPRDEPGSLREMIAAGKERVRRQFSATPACRGNIVVLPNRGNVIVEFAISGRMDIVDSIARLSELHRSRAQYKVTATDYLVDKPKRISGAIDPAVLATLDGHAKRFTFDMKCKVSGFRWVRDIQKRYGLIGNGSLIDKDSSCEMGIAHIALRPPETDVFDHDNVILRQEGFFGRQNHIALSIENFQDERLIGCYNDILRELEQRGATTRNHRSYNSLYIDYLSTLLPPFPHACDTCLHISFPGDGSYLKKD